MKQRIHGTETAEVLCSWGFQGAKPGSIVRQGIDAEGVSRAIGAIETIRFDPPERSP